MSVSKDETKKLFKNVRTHDVMCGRGGLSNKHNLHFRIIVDKNKAEYLQARKSEKRVIAQRVVDAIRARGGRFIKKVDEMVSDSPWYEVDEKRALEKTSQALREGLNVREDAPVTGSYGRIEVPVQAAPVLPPVSLKDKQTSDSLHQSSEDKSKGAVNKKAKSGEHEKSAEAAAPVASYGHGVHPAAVHQAYAAYPPYYAYPGYGYTAYAPPTSQHTSSHARSATTPSQGHYYSAYPPPSPYPAHYAHPPPPTYPYPGYYAAPYLPAGTSPYAYYVPGAATYAAAPGTQPQVPLAPAPTKGKETTKKVDEKEERSTKSQAGPTSKGTVVSASSSNINDAKATTTGATKPAGVAQNESSSSNKNGNTGHKKSCKPSEKSTASARGPKGNKNENEATDKNAPTASI